MAREEWLISDPQAGRSDSLDGLPREVERIGVAFDGWDESRAALGVALEVARAFGAELELLTVADPDTAASQQAAHVDNALDGHAELARAYLQSVVAELPDDVRVQAHVLQGQVAGALCDAVRDLDLELLALGSRRRGAIARVALGSVSDAVLRHQPCSLLICPGGATPPAGALGRGGA